LIRGEWSIDCAEPNNDSPLNAFAAGMWGTEQYQVELQRRYKAAVDAAL
jgi:hypothetical protein